MPISLLFFLTLKNIFNYQVVNIFKKNLIIIPGAIIKSGKFGSAKEF